MIFFPVGYVLVCSLVPKLFRQPKIYHINEVALKQKKEMTYKTNNRINSNQLFRNLCHVS